MLTLKLRLTITTIFLSVLSLCAQAGMVKKEAKPAAAENQKTETFLVLGNCGMCQRTIEKAALAAGASKAVWDVETDQLTATFDSSKTSADAILKAVAQSGYDNMAYKAPDAAYNDLHACCKYDRSGAPSTAKSCDKPGAQKN